MTTATARPRATKIVATIGPASWEPEVLRSLLEAGVDVVRINTAHNTIEARRPLVAAIRAAARDVGRHVAILQDLAGPKPRTGPLPEGEVIRLNRDDRVALIAGDDLMLPTRITIDDPDLVDRLGPGQRVLMADGLIELVVEEADPAGWRARVVRGGKLRGRQGVTAPGLPLPPRRISAGEAEDIAFAAEQDLEYLGVSFVTSPRDVDLVREALHSHGGRAGIVAKIERPEALHVLHDITHVSDAIMVARGDLGVQLPLEEVPIVQKQIIALARRHGTPVITATQMLESMTTQPLPTRAEASDVANAVLDGSDAVMLSAETATGLYPLEAVQVMDRIALAAERGPSSQRPEPEEGKRPATVASTIARAASDIVRRSALVDVIAVFTRSGFSAREVARERPPVPFVALTNSAFVARQLSLIWGAQVLVAPFADETERLIATMTDQLRAAGYVHPADHVLFVGSLTVHQEPGHTDVLHLRQIS